MGSTTRDERYDDHATERLVLEPPKRVDAPERTPFERDRARVVHAASTRRLAAKTQVVGPEVDDFGRNRLTHSLEVAQVARDVSRALGSQPDLAETAALAHDLGHPPFGHNGERVLAGIADGIGGFEGNAQTLRLLTHLEAKAFDGQGRSAGLNLTRAALDACTKYPWERGAGPDPEKFGYYRADEVAFTWMRAPGTAEQSMLGQRRCIEAQIMDLADDVAYSVHDVEDGVVAGRIDLGALARGDLDRAALWQTARSWYLPECDDDRLDGVLLDLCTIGSWPTSEYTGTRGDLAGLKNLTSDLIGRFCETVQQSTLKASAGPFVRYGADLSVPEETRVEIAVLKSIAAHFVMEAQERVKVMARQAEVLTELVGELLERPEGLDAMFAADWATAGSDADRLRVVIDQVASLTDARAVEWHGS